MFKINFKQSLTNSLLIQSSAILYITGNCSTAKAFSSNFVTVDLNNIVLPKILITKTEVQFLCIMLSVTQSTLHTAHVKIQQIK